MTRPLRLLPLLLALALLAPGGARAADSHAPRGARLDWLPTDGWVMSSWLPYDEARLDLLTHTTRADRAAWLDDHRSLGALARHHGWSGSMQRLADALIAPRLPHVRATLRPVLRRRALDTLTQPHLAHHVLFHIFHTPAIPAAAHRLFGMRPSTFRRLRDSGMSPVTIGARTGRSAARVQAGLRALLAERGRAAVRAGAMSTAQARALLALQTAGLPAFVTRRYRTPAQQVAFLCRMP